jgi:hypothetical protein
MESITKCKSQYSSGIMPSYLPACISDAMQKMRYSKSKEHQAILHVLLGLVFY